MIYREKGVRTSKGEKVPNPNNLTPLEMLVNTPIFEVEEHQYTEEYKLSKAYYFISGEFTEATNGEYHRNNGGLLSRDLICIDIEDTKMETTGVLNTIQESLKEYKYVLYSTFKHEESNPRLRLVLEPSRDIVKDEYKPTIQHVMALVGVNYDTKCETWSQLSGLPIVKKGNEHIFIKHLEGKPYPVQEAVKEEKKIITKCTSEHIQNFIKVSHDQAISIMGKYIENEQEKLLERNDYYLSCLTVVAKSVVSGEIEYDTAIECMELLALNNNEWKENNLKELNGEIARAKGNVDYFKNKYTFLGKFQKTQQKIKLTNAVTNANLEVTTDEKGKVIQTLENLEKIILSITPIAYNELTDVIEIKDKQGKIKPLEKRDKELLRMDIEKRFKFKAKVIDLDTAIVSASDKFRYHPIKNKILAVSWDGLPRAESFFIDVLGVEDNVYNRECTRKWLLASVTRLFKTGVKFDEMIILQGGQGIGKSTTLQRLSLGYYTDITDKLSDETTFKVMRTWLVELSELSAMIKTDSDSFKAWLSATKDTVRKKYATDPVDYPRVFTVLGTTNNKEILKDRTGNRRYWLMYCDKDRIKKPIWEMEDEYILQVWAEVYQWYQNKEILLISDETKCYMEKLTHTAMFYNPLEDRLFNLLEMELPSDWVDIVNNHSKRFELKNHVNDYLNFGILSDKFKAEIKLDDITTNEIVYFLSDGTCFGTNLKGSSEAKEINKIMSNNTNWESSNKIKRSTAYLRGYKRKKAVH